jgi:hypothetical protein
MSSGWHIWRDIYSSLAYFVETIDFIFNKNGNIHSQNQNMTVTLVASAFVQKNAES